MAAEGQAHAHDRVARLAQREIDRLVCGRAGVGLDIGVLGAEESLGSLDGQGLDLVDIVLAFVVAFPGVAPEYLLVKTVPVACMTASEA